MLLTYHNSWPVELPNFKSCAELGKLDIFASLMFCLHTVALTVNEIINRSIDQCWADLKKISTWQQRSSSGAALLWAERKTERSEPKVGCSRADRKTGVEKNHGAGAEREAGGRAVRT